MGDAWRLSATELAACLARGDVSAVDAVSSQIERIEALSALNAVVVRRYDAALAEARLADERRARGEPLGALHGVPVTIKECLDVAGTPATFGLPARRGDRAVVDDPYVARWRDAGAIVVAKTNVPQLMIFIETDNPLYGRTNNPWNLERTCGGSSGGEAALIAGGGSPLGLGADVGGSLRVPAAFCGITSFKPTSGRLDDTTRLDLYAGQTAIVSQEGPLARTVADVALGYETALGATVPRDVDVRSLRIGFFEEAGAFRATAAARRAVREAVDALARRGATVVRFEPPHVDEAMDLFFGILSADGASGAKAALGTGPRDPRIAELVTIASQPRVVVVAVERLLRLFGQHGQAAIVRNYGFTSTRHYWKLVEGVAAYRKIFARALDAAPGGPLDALVAPPVGLAALRHGQSARVLTAGAYAPLFNVLGYPCGTQPFTAVRDGEESGRPSSRDRMERAAAEAERGSAGLPVGVQVVARPWREDVAFAAMFALEEAARARADFPFTPVAPRRSS